MFLSVMRSRCGSPATPTTSARVTTSMFGASSMRSTRYRDIAGLRPAARIDHRDLARVAREEQRALARGVRAADDRDVAGPGRARASLIAAP